MRKTELVQKIAENTGVALKDTGAVVSALFEIIGDEIAKGEKVQIVGFGTFETRKSSERKAMNPQTGEKMTIPAHNAPKFKAGKSLKKKVER